MKMRLIVTRWSPSKHEMVSINQRVVDVQKRGKYLHVGQDTFTIDGQMTARSRAGRLYTYRLEFISEE